MKITSSQALLASKPMLDALYDLAVIGNAYVEDARSMKDIVPEDAHPVLLHVVSTGPCYVQVCCSKAALECICLLVFVSCAV